MGLLVSGIGIDPSGVEDSSAAIQAKVDALPAEGGDLYFPPGAYRFADIEVTKPLTIRGAGHHGMAVDEIPTRLLTDSATADMFQVDAGGVTFTDVALINDRGTAPTAGAGIAVAGGYFLNLTRCSVIGFYDNVTINDAWLYNISDSHFHDAVHDYVKIGNSVNSDVGGSVIEGNSFTPAFHARNARAFLRWEAAGGMRFFGNKMNANNNMNPDPEAITTHPPTNGLDCAIADGAWTIILLIYGNSIECPTGSTNACIRVVLAGPSNTGRLEQVKVIGNQLTGALFGVVVNPAVVNKISDVDITDNTLYAHQTTGILTNNVQRLNVGKNTHDYLGSSSVVPVSIGSGVTNYHLDRQMVNGDGVPLFTDAAAGLSGAEPGDLNQRYQRSINNVTSAASYTTLWRFTPTDTRGGTIEVTCTGIVSGVGPFVRREVHSYLRDGGVTLSQVGETSTQGAAIDLSLDTSAVSGEIQVKVRRNSAGGGTGVTGRCTVEVDGPLAAARKGA